jgi:hypothetical protein
MTSERYLLHPRAPLVFGAGRPADFGLAGSTLSFPFPSTVAGAMRAAHEVAAGRTANPYAANQVELEWLSLARFDWLDDATNAELLLPRPADSVYLNGKIYALMPREHRKDCISDLAPELRILEIDAPPAELKGKPDEAPAWWTAGAVTKWLAKPGDCAGLESIEESLADTRTHVVVERQGKGAKDGQLFRTTGRDFSPRAGSRLGLAIAVGLRRIQGSPTLHGEARRLGGEGRFVRVESCPQHVDLPLRPHINGTRPLVRFVLVTPAIFEKCGWHPDWMKVVPAPAHADAPGAISGNFKTSGGGVLRLTLVAAAISRAQSYSGWQAGKDGRAGPGQPWRVVPAGSVFWLRVEEGDPADLWGISLCQGRWREDGWGVGLVGAVQDQT